MALSRSWTILWLTINLLTFTFANGQSPPACTANPSGGNFGSPSTIEPTGYGVKTNSSFHPIVQPGKQPNKDQWSLWSKYLCMVPIIQPNNVVCVTPQQDLSPNQSNENEFVGEREQEYCNYLGKLFSFKTSGCARLSIEPDESETGQGYQIDACALSYSPTPNISDVNAWYFISSKTESVPNAYKIGECKTNPLVLYQMAVHSVQ